MDTQANKDVARLLYENIGKPDNVWLDYLADDATWTFFGSHVFAGTLHGKQEIIDKLLTPMLARGEDFAFRILNLWADGDTVIVEGKGDMKLFAGGRYDNDYCIVVKVKDGKVASIREYLDTELVTRAFGS
jgi:hypothetical protein